MRSKKNLILGSIALFIIIIGIISQRNKSSTESTENTAKTEQSDSADQEQARDTNLPASPPPTSSDAKKIVSLSVSSTFIKSVIVNEKTLQVHLKESNSQDPIFATYYNTGDKRNKLLAIESIRWMVKMPGIDKVDLTIDADGRVSHVVIPRDEIETYLGTNLSSYSDGEGSINDKWRIEFGRTHDSKKGRLAIVQKFQP